MSLIERNQSIVNQNPIRNFFYFMTQFSESIPTNKKRVICYSVSIYY
jgi:hypothetical protein